MEYEFIVMTPRHTQKCIFIRDQFFDKKFLLALASSRHPPEAAVQFAHLMLCVHFLFIIIFHSPSSSSSSFSALMLYDIELTLAKKNFYDCCSFRLSPPIHPSSHFRPPSFATLHRGSEKICNFLE